GRGMTRLTAARHRLIIARFERAGDRAMASIWVDLLGAEVRFRDAGGLRTRSIEAGEGEPLILLHGSGGHAEAYSRNVLPLANDFRVHAVDMIGHGLTDKPESGYRARDY